MLRYAIVFLLLVCSALPAAAQVPLELKARNAILIDADTGTILYDKDSHRAIYPASMTKIMTVYLIFEQVKSGRMKWEDLWTVSANAQRQQGSRSFVQAGSQISVYDCTLGIIVHSGNDCAVVAAEAIAGSEAGFAVMMTEKAVELGMKESVFKNASGLPNPDHWSSSADLAVLALNMIRNFPDYYPMYATKAFTINNITQPSRNPLFRSNFEGADGLKTGYTEDAGYCFVGSAVRNGRRLIGVVAGLESPNQRSQDIQALLEWGFNQFDNYRVATVGNAVLKAPVWLGTVKEVALETSKTLALTLPISASKGLEAKVTYTTPLQAPLKKGQEVGVITLTSPLLKQTYNVPLVVSTDVPALGASTSLQQRIIYAFTGDAG
ncbi:MAG: D-alanyl-D-alanine carboxypeptidase [Alphaproteobacteria bacterium]|nr:D-alanyl-D-alanine carboxypeptidase [Alphaproteobacteria bacterium]